jgi:hypothetical protein
MEIAQLASIHALLSLLQTPVRAARKVLFVRLIMPRT